jgi:hypothetical protein
MKIGKVEEVLEFLETVFDKWKCAYSVRKKAK